MLFFYIFLQLAIYNVRLTAGQFHCRMLHDDIPENPSNTRANRLAVLRYNVNLYSDWPRGISQLESVSRYNASLSHKAYPLGKKVKLHNLIHRFS